MDISLIEWLLLLCRWPGAGCRWPSLGGPALRWAQPPLVPRLPGVGTCCYPCGCKRCALPWRPCSVGWAGLRRPPRPPQGKPVRFLHDWIYCTRYTHTGVCLAAFNCCLAVFWLLMMVLGRLRQSSRVSQRTQLSALPCRIAEAGDGARAASSACRSVGRPAPPPVAPVRAPLPVGPASAGRHGQG